jgi:alcohol oxidase
VSNKYILHCGDSLDITTYHGLGGTAACVVAGRLAAWDPSLSILILEGGQHTLNQPAHVQPYRSGRHLAPTSTTMTFNLGNPSPRLNGRAPIVQCAHCVGGGSSVNCS